MLDEDSKEEFWNVLKGEMSIIGPRPPNQVDMQSATWQQVLSIAPGMTGLAQLQGDPTLDVQYVQSRSLWLDVKLCCQQLVLIIKKRYAK